MMTLDEVIIGIKEQMGLGDPILIDALHYLKDMKNLEEDYDILYNKYWREFNQQQANPPLTWDELKTMEGKPIWVEGSWEIIDGCYEEYFSTDTGGIYYRKNDECYGDYGKDWQAYRREKR